MPRVSFDAKDSEARPVSKSFGVCHLSPLLLATTASILSNYSLLLSSLGSTFIPIGSPAKASMARNNRRW